MSNFHQDPWRPGAAVQPAAATPVQDDPPKLSDQETPPAPAETPAEPAATPTEHVPPAEDAQAVQDELERALAEMRGQK
jgi:hypothetical protein